MIALMVLVLSFMLSCLVALAVASVRAVNRAELTSVRRSSVHVRPPADHLARKSCCA